jgi:release factor glutamine methyltransferase
MDGKSMNDVSISNMSAKTIAEMLAAARHRGIDRIDAEVLLCHVLGRDRTFLYTWPDRLLSASELQHLDQLLLQRRQGHPVAHLTGTREFWSLPLQVDSSTLIPRPDTETLVQVALALPLSLMSTVLDAGTGTGAIALALASERPQWQLYASDRQLAAAQLAHRNATALAMNAAIICANWLSAFAADSFDMVVSNPPYIAASDPHLTRGDVRFEPRSALVAEDDGLADLCALIVDARRVLKSGGWLVLEHGYQQAAAVRELLALHDYTDIASHRDLGDNERITRGRYER